MVLVAHRFISIAVKFYSIRFSAYLSKAKNNFGQMAIPGLLKLRMKNKSLKFEATEKILLEKKIFRIL